MNLYLLSSCHTHHDLVGMSFRFVSTFICQRIAWSEFVTLMIRFPTLVYKWVYRHVSSQRPFQWNDIWFEYRIGIKRATVL